MFSWYSDRKVYYVIVIIVGTGSSLARIFRRSKKRDGGAGKRTLNTLQKITKETKRNGKETAENTKYAEKESESKRGNEEKPPEANGFQGNESKIKS